VPRRTGACLRYAGFLEGAPGAILAAIREHNLEGIVAKVVSSRYEPGKRSGAWSKFKCGYREHFVVGGYTLGGGYSRFGALIVGYFDQGKLRYASKVGAAFTERETREFLDGVATIQQPDCPFEAIPASAGTSWSYGLTTAESRTAVWLKPILVCEVRFTEWTREGRLRHPIFEGFRADRAAIDVKREG
jgi:bifunctional non-homologous end joining protein LigD